MNALIDWLSFSIPIDSDEMSKSINQILYQIGLDDVEWVTSLGHDGYRKSLQYNGITLNYDAVFTTNRNFALLTFSGQGCRTYERIFGLQIATLIVNKVGTWSVTRLDLAYDDISDDDFHYLDLGIIYSHMDSEDPKFYSRLQTWVIKQGNKDREALFGSRSSRVYIRIYDKRLERLNKTGECPHAHWVRLEIEFKAEKAHKAAVLISERPDLVGQIFGGILLDYLGFTTLPRSAFTHRHIRRDAHIAEWWKAFLEGIKPLTLEPGPDPDRNYKKIRKWICEQTTRNLAIVGLVESAKIFDKLMEMGRTRLTDEDRQIIESAREGMRG